MATGFFKTAFYFMALNICFYNTSAAQSYVMYDIVLSGGRVIDPETKLDAIKNVGILNNRIAQISSEPLQGKQAIINARVAAETMEGINGNKAYALPHSLVIDLLKKYKRIK